MNTSLNECSTWGTVRYPKEVNTNLSSAGNSTYHRISFNIAVGLFAAIAFLFTLLFDQKESGTTASKQLKIIGNSKRTLVFKSNSNDKELDGMLTRRNAESTIHTIDFGSKLLKMEVLSAGKTNAFVYPVIKSIETSNADGHTTRLLIDSRDLKEVAINSSKPYLVYQYSDASRVVFNDIDRSEY